MRPEFGIPAICWRESSTVIGTKVEWEMGKGVGVRRDQLKEIQHPWGDFSMRDRTG